MKKLKKNWLPTLFIFVGIGLILHPFLINVYNEWQQKQLIQELSDTMINVASDNEVEQVSGTETSNQGASLKKSGSNPLSGLPLEGKLEIKAIDLEMPILKGASAEHLKLTACSVVPSVKMGSEENYVIAGHRGRSFGRHFNRLNELDKGDEVILTNKQGNKYVYLVKSNYVVDQSELWVLETHEKNELTLITCDPVGAKNPTNRRIVKAIVK